MKTIKQVAEYLNISIEETKNRVKELFNPIPPNFTDEQVQQIKNHSAQKQLPQSPAPTVIQTATAPTNKEDKTINKAEYLQGKKLGQAATAAFIDGYTEALQAGKQEFFNQIVDTALQNSARLQELTQQIKQLERPKVEPLSIKAAISTHTKALPPAEELISQYQLSPAEEEDWADLL